MQFTKSKRFLYIIQIKATQSEQKMNMSQLIAATRTPLVVTTEVSPIIEVPEFKDLERPAIYEI